jgi:hypothetical protein
MTGDHPREMSTPVLSLPPRNNINITANREEQKWPKRTSKITEISKAWSVGIGKCLPGKEGRIRNLKTNPRV